MFTLHYDTRLCTQAFPSRHFLHSHRRRATLSKSFVPHLKNTVEPASVQLYNRSAPFFYDVVLVRREQNSAAFMGLIGCYLFAISSHEIGESCTDCVRLVVILSWLTNKQIHVQTMMLWIFVTDHIEYRLIGLLCQELLWSDSFTFLPHFTFLS